MEISGLLRHQIVKRRMTQPTGKVADATIDLWELMATQIISIVGEGGFNSLYVHSVFLTRSTFPWLTAVPLSPQTDHRFAELKISLEGQSPEQASTANSLLLINFHRHPSLVNWRAVNDSYFTLSRERQCFGKARQGVQNKPDKYDD
jgi:hypothetical protein